MELEFTAEVGELSGFPILYLSGELDMAVEPALRLRIAEVVDSNRCALVHVNDVSYSDANSLGMLLRGKAVFAQRGGAVAFVCCQSQVLRALETLGFVAQMDVFDDMEEAVEFLKQRCS